MQRRRNQKASQKIMRSTWEVDYTEAHTDDSESHNTTEGGDDEENNSSSSVTSTNYSYPSLECVKAMKRNFPCLRSYVCRRRLSCVAIFTIGIISIGLIVTLFYGKSNFFGEEMLPPFVCWVIFWRADLDVCREERLLTGLSWCLRTIVATLTCIIGAAAVEHPYHLHTAIRHY
jgi:hypothetical protein